MRDEFKSAKYEEKHDLNSSENVMCVLKYQAL